MKNLVSLFSIICLVLAPVSSFAQDAGRAQMKKDVQLEVAEQMDQLTNTLQLSEEQIPKVKMILNEYLSTKAELNNLNMEPEDLKRRMDVLNENIHFGMEKILSPDQMQVYKKYLLEQKSE